VYIVLLNIDQREFTPPNPALFAFGLPLLGFEQAVEHAA